MDYDELHTYTYNAGFCTGIGDLQIFFVYLAPVLFYRAIHLHLPQALEDISNTQAAFGYLATCQIVKS